MPYVGKGGARGKFCFDQSRLNSDLLFSHGNTSRKFASLFSNLKETTGSNIRNSFHNNYFHRYMTCDPERGPGLELFWRLISNAIDDNMSVNFITGSASSYKMISSEHNLTNPCPYEWAIVSHRRSPLHQ